MRYADHAFEKAKSRDEGARVPALDKKATAAGFDDTADYLDDVQGREDTRVFDGDGNRTCWMNEKEGLLGWNNGDQPSTSTAYPTRGPVLDFERNKDKEATRLGVAVEDIQERRGLTQDERQAPEADRSQEASKQAEEMSQDSDRSQEASKQAEEMSQDSASNAPEEKQSSEPATEEEREHDFPSLPDKPEKSEAEEDLDREPDPEDDLTR